MKVGAEAVVTAIRALTRERGYPPTVREVAARLGLSTSATYARLARLRGERVEWVTGAARTLRLLGNYSEIPNSSQEDDDG